MAKEWFVSGTDDRWSVKVNEIRKVFGDGLSHNAFPDICYYRGRYYLGLSHHSAHTGDALSRAMVLVSQNATTWFVNQVFHTGRETEEPKFMVFDGKLFVYFFESYFRDDTPREITQRHPAQLSGEDRKWISVAGWCSSSIDGESWSQPVKIKQDWKHWRPNAWDGVAYCVAHPKHVGTACKLERSLNGIEWDTVCVLPVPADDKPNEASIAFGDDGRMFVFIRRDSTSCDRHSYLLVADPPYVDWATHDLGHRLSGPLCFMFGSELFLGARFFTAGGAPHAGLFHVNENWSVELLHVFPSEGDCSYMGICEHDQAPNDGQARYFLTYYSSHEALGGDFWNNKPSIYVADVEIGARRVAN